MTVNPSNRTIDTNDQLSSVVLLGIALAGSAVMIGAYLVIGS